MTQIETDNYDLKRDVAWSTAGSIPSISTKHECFLDGYDSGYQTALFDLIEYLDSPRFGYNRSSASLGDIRAWAEKWKSLR